MLSAIIIEDQPPAQRILKKYIEDIGTLQLKATFTDALQAMEFLNMEAVDVLFLDIHLPKISGIDFLKAMPNPPHVILTTAFPDYALESYEFNVVDYLLKPFSFQRFVKAVSKIPLKTSTSAPAYYPNIPEPKTEIFIKSGYDHIKVRIEDILYIQADADYTEIITPEKKYLSNEPLRYWEENLDDNHFFRVHKSYIIHTNHIEKISGNRIFLLNDLEIPIGRAYKDQFLEKFLK